MFSVLWIIYQVKYFWIISIFAGNSTLLAVLSCAQGVAASALGELLRADDSSFSLGMCRCIVPTWITGQFSFAHVACGVLQKSLRDSQMASVVCFRGQCRVCRVFAVISVTPEEARALESPQEKMLQCPRLSAKDLKPSVEKMAHCISYAIQLLLLVQQ